MGAACCGRKSISKNQDQQEIIAEIVHGEPKPISEEKKPSLEVAKR